MTLKVTIEEEATGEVRSIRIVKPGEYLLTCALPCHIRSTETDERAGTHVITVANPVQELPLPEPEPVK